MPANSAQTFRRAPEQQLVASVTSCAVKSLWFPCATVSLRRLLLFYPTQLLNRRSERASMDRRVATARTIVTMYCDQVSVFTYCDNWLKNPVSRLTSRAAAAFARCSMTILSAKWEQTDRR